MSYCPSAVRFRGSSYLCGTQQTMLDHWIVAFPRWLRLPVIEVRNWRDILPSIIIGMWSWAKSQLPFCVARFGQHKWIGEQNRLLQFLSENWLSITDLQRHCSVPPQRYKFFRSEKFVNVIFQTMGSRTLGYVVPRIYSTISFSRIKRRDPI